MSFERLKSSHIPQEIVQPTPFTESDITKDRSVFIQVETMHHRKQEMANATGKLGGFVALPGGYGVSLIASNGTSLGLTRHDVHIGFL